MTSHDGIRTWALSDLSSISFSRITIALAIGLLFSWYFASWYRLRHIPGPFLNSISLLPMNIMTMSGKLSFRLKELGDKYGPLVRVGPNEVLFGDADSYRAISAVRSDFTRARDEAREELKAKLSPGYAGRDNGGFEPDIDRIVNQFVHLVESKYVSTADDFRPMEFAHKSQYFALDVVGQLSFGEALGFVARDEDLWGYVKTNDETFPVFAVMLNTPYIGRILQHWPLSKLLPFSNEKYGFGKLMHVAQGIVDRKLDSGAKPDGTMIYHHLRNGLTIAGSDSTATALRMTMLCLLNTPSSLNTLRREIDDGIRKGRISSPISDAEAREMPCPQAVIKEGIRMFPLQTALNYKQVAPGGAEVCGHFLPEGTQLSVNIHRLMRSKETFGADADVFRPERWIEAAAADEERFREMGAVVELDFGHGRFQCLGKAIAFMELNKLFVELLRRFDFAVVTPQEPLKLWDAGFWVTDDFKLRVSRRSDLES
ncbi:cytochrome p450 [Colletotrichum sojae]|uniref:Cytochrome p450 n=1 Tax=Colletotrichum sojae TaxID=2175907 RepID=A0A8H6JRE6_9PEZI|nr:cytochrome p450 [Colletotrichum sojae]